MTWTPQAPREGGWYWYRTADTLVPPHSYTIIELFEQMEDGKSVTYYVRETADGGEHERASDRNQFDRGEWWSRSLHPPFPEGIGRTPIHAARDALAETITTLAGLVLYSEALANQMGRPGQAVTITMGSTFLSNLRAILERAEAARALL